ncbi:MAG: hypothetical protein N3I35_11445 [Clostridia bacterium]|nr:hypothetical protein [Clostridia bacterium]
MISFIGLLSALGIIIVPIVLWKKNKGQKHKLLKAFSGGFACFVLMLVMVGYGTPPQNNVQAQKKQQTTTQKQKTSEENKSPEQSGQAQNGGEKESSIASEYKIGDTGLQGVVMTESLIKYLSEAEKNPVKTKDKAENITKNIYKDVTDNDGSNMPEKEMMTKLYQAQIYYNENMNSEYSSVNGLLIEEFGGRINKSRGVPGAAQRMNNITAMYEMVTSLRSSQ